MRTPTALLILIACSVWVLPVVAPASPKWLPIEKSEVLALFVSEFGLGNDDILSMEQWLNQLRIKYADDPKRLARVNEEQSRMKAEQGDEDEIWFVGRRSLPLLVAMIGVGEQVHSLRIGVPVVNLSKEEGERTFRVLSDLFEAIYPDWSDAKNWPTTSLKDSWNRLAAMQRGDDPDKTLVRETRNGITSTTFGVPPDLVIYAVTVRKRCLPTATTGNPYERIVC